jgi:hypothetical protein
VLLGVIEELGNTAIDTRFWEIIETNRFFVCLLFLKWEEEDPDVIPCCPLLERPLRPLNNKFISELLFWQNKCQYDGDLRPCTDMASIDIWFVQFHLF